MRTYPRQKSVGGFNLVPKHTGIIYRQMNSKQMGKGITENFFSRDVGPNNIKNLTKKIDFMSIKPNKPKRYISLNL